MTQNLLHGDWTAEQIEEILIRHPARPILPPIGSEDWRRAAGNPIVCHWLAPLRSRAERECCEPLPELTDELYADFGRTGNRLGFEKVYFERRRRLARAAISLLLSREDDPWHQRLMDSTVAKLASIFEEVSWALPAHVNWDNEDTSGKEPLQIDLFCAETANLMAEMVDLFGGLIPAALRERIRERLRHDVFENYLNRPFHWKEVSHNWNAVCHQGVVGAALSQLEDAHLLARLLDSARRCLPIFLSGFGKDGGCLEGPSYWGYGFGWFTLLNEQLESRTEGELSLFEGDEHILEIARYGPRFSLSGGHLVNFADSAATGGLRPSLLSYLGKRLDDPSCLHCAWESYRRLAEEGLDLDAERCDPLLLVRLFLGCPRSLPPPEPAGMKDCFLPDLGVLVAHGTDRLGHQWDFAAKAGHNGEHHNHNDCGSFIVNIDGVRLIVEIGHPEYVHDFFVPGKRYEFLAARTLGHSLPLINGVEQAEGTEHASRAMSHCLAEDHAQLVIDATQCYPTGAGCRKYVRSFEFNKRFGRLTMEDAFDMDRTGALESAIIASHPISIHENHALIDGGTVKLILQPLPGTRLERVETFSYRDHHGNDAIIQRLVLKPDLLTSLVRIGLEIFTADADMPNECSEVFSATSKFAQPPL
jgi:hypothetical protein